MSAQSSSTASKDLSREKSVAKLPSFSRDSDGDFAKHDQSADQRNGQGAVAAGGQRKTSPMGSSAQFQPLRLLVVDESNQVRRMCCEVAETFGFVGTEAETI